MSGIVEIKFNGGRNKIVVSRSNVSEPNNSVADNKPGREKLGLISVGNSKDVPNSREKFSVGRLNSKDKLETDVIKLIIAGNNKGFSRNAGDITASRESDSKESSERVRESYSDKEELPSIAISNAISNVCDEIN